MPPEVPRNGGRGRRLAWTFARFHVGAFAATVVDFGVMIALVELAGLQPVSATVAGAALGALTNFLLGRMWVFRERVEHWAAQGWRYAVVSAASAGLNAAGEHLLHDVARVEYVEARVVVSLVVTLLWNFPMQRLFVFPEGRGA
jgi:putative flippase GtrA